MKKKGLRRAPTSPRRIPAKPKASTRDIVGDPPKDPVAKVPRKWQKHYRRLVLLRDQIGRRQAALSSIAAEQTPNYGSHMADAATDAFDRDLALGMLSSEQNALYQIDQALDRIRHGSYGTCELTGKPIEPARLEAVPWARFSLAAEKKLEEQGTRRRTTLGERESVGKFEPVSDEDLEAD